MVNWLAELLNSKEEVCILGYLLEKYPQDIPRNGISKDTFIRNKVVVDF